MSVGVMGAEGGGDPPNRPFAGAVLVRPAFIFGVPRSGTTLLVRLLGSHPCLAPLYETRFLRNLVRFCARAGWLGRKWPGAGLGTGLLQSYFERECRILKRKTLAYHQDAPPMCVRYTAEELSRELDAWLRSLQDRDFSADGVYRSAREFVDRLFGLHCRRMNKPFWVNKTPGLLNHLAGLARLYPDAKCLHIIRDGRDVAVSNLGQKWGPATIHDAACRWRSLMRQGRAVLRKQVVDYLEVRYEQLILEPQPTLARILAFLALEGAPEEILKGLAVHRESVGAWRKRFSADDRRTFARTAGDLLIELGYEKDRSWGRSFPS